MSQETSRTRNAASRDGTSTLGHSYRQDLVATIVGEEADELPDDDLFTEEEEEEMRETRQQAHLLHSYREWYSRAISALEVEVEPDEVVVCFERAVFRHLITNSSSFPIVCRLLSTSAGGFLRLQESCRFVIEAHGCYPLTVVKSEGYGAGRTEVLQLQVLPVDSAFQQQEMWELRAQSLFNLGRKPVSYKIRYRRQPSYTRYVEQVFAPMPAPADLTAPFKKGDTLDVNEFAILDTFMNLGHRKEEQQKRLKLLQEMKERQMEQKKGG